VRAFARSADRIGIDDPKLEPFAGDATDPHSVRAALEDVDAVIVALGAPRSAKSAMATTHLFSDSTRVLLEAMAEVGPRRVVFVTGYGAGDSQQAQSRLERLAHRFVLGGAYADKDRQEAMIRSSDLDWLIVRPVILTNGKRTGRARLLRDPKAWRNGLVSRSDVAETLVREAAAPTVSREAPVLAY
jgi:putative NADH-flavin reductase